MLPCLLADSLDHRHLLVTNIRQNAAKGFGMSVVKIEEFTALELRKTLYYLARKFNIADRFDG